MSFYMLALISIIFVVIWLHYREHVLLFAGAAAITIFTVLADLYYEVDEQYIVCTLLVLAILVFQGREKE